MCYSTNHKSVKRATIWGTYIMPSVNTRAKRNTVRPNAHVCFITYLAKLIVKLLEVKYCLIIAISLDVKV